MAARQSTSTPMACGVIENVRLPATKVTGTPASRAGRPASFPRNDHRTLATNGTPPTLLEHEQLDAAGDVELDAGHVRGEVGAEKGDRVRDVLRLPRPLEDRSVGDPLVHRGARHVEG